MPSRERVLIVGYRSGLRRAVEALEIPYAVWHDRPLEAKRVKGPVRIQPFGARPEALRDRARTFAPYGPFTHVIAGTEGGVVAASHARRVLNARRSTHTTLLRCHDKLEMKRHLRREGIPMTDFIDGNEVREVADLFRQLGRPLVVKDRKRSGGRGIDIVSSEAEAATVRRKNRIVERFIDAREVSVESFIHGSVPVFENITEYVHKKHVNLLPADLAESLEKTVLALSRQVIRCLRVAWGMAHLEVYLSQAGPLFGEIALRPPGGYIMEALSHAYDFDAWRAFVEVELDRPRSFPENAGAVAAAIILHPGSGRLVALEGVDEIRAHPHVTAARIKVFPGDVISPRLGVGNDVGHVLLRAASRDAVLADVAFVHRHLKFQVE